MPRSCSAFEDVLTGLLRESGALTVMLITKQGSVVAEAGNISGLNSTAMAALVAGMFSATREVARLVGEDQFSILLQQGERRHIHISLVAAESMMIIVFEDQNRTGMIRHSARKASEKLAVLLAADRSAEQATSEISAPAFKEYALNLIDRIFQA
jgi:predicted regulator of Ras-like GTPase activity (Roadblock/LC7/MglB family)